MRLNKQALQIGTDWGDNSHTKLYFFEGERKAIIDTGVASSPVNDIAPYLEYYGYKLADIDLILNTHGHFDHAGGNPPVVAAGKAEIWMHQADSFMVEDPARHFDTYTAPLLRLVGKEDQVPRQREEFVAAAGPKQKVSRGLKDGDVIDLGRGIELKVVGLPGHTLGSVGYHWEKEGMLFCGDSAMGQGSRAGILPVLFHPLTYQRTLERLLTMPLRLIGLGHIYQARSVSSNPIKKGTEITQYFRDCQEINNLLLEAVSKATLRHWGEPFAKVMLTAVDELSQRMFLRRDPATGLPPGGVRTLGAYYLELMAAGW